MDLNEEDSIPKVFDAFQKMQYTEFLSPWMRIPPDQMDNMHKAIAQFTVTKNYLDRKPRMFLVVKDETRATVHSMPDIVVGFTDFLDIQFKQLLVSPTQDRDVFEV